MRCVKPFVNREGAFGCGQCLPCRVSKRRTWTHRIMLEAMDHGTQNCSFVTLTHSDDAVRDVDPRVLQLWLKRLRKRLHPHSVRYFSCGEYGDQSGRPHYHAALFGHGSCRGGRAARGEPCPCPQCSVVRETWGFGHVLVGRLTVQSAAYISGYVTKKMTRWDDPRLDGRAPEFARMSLRPGIGASAMWNVASEVMRYNLELRGDVPGALRVGSKIMPLGRYLRGKLREMVGNEKGAPQEALQAAANQLSVVRAFAWANDRSVASVYEEINSPYAEVLTARAKLKEGINEALKI